MHQNKEYLTIGEKIKYIRTEYGYTQEMLGALCHTSKQAILHWEKGQAEPTLENLATICEVCNVPLPKFFEDLDIATFSHIVRHEKDMDPDELYIINIIRRLNAYQKRLIRNFLQNFIPKKK